MQERRDLTGWALLLSEATANPNDILESPLCDMDRRQTFVLRLCEHIAEEYQRFSNGELWTMPLRDVREERTGAERRRMREQYFNQIPQHTKMQPTLMQIARGLCDIHERAAEMLDILLDEERLQAAPALALLQEQQTELPPHDTLLPEQNGYARSHSDSSPGQAA